MRVRFYMDGNALNDIELPDGTTSFEQDGDSIEIDAPPIEIRGHFYELRTERLLYLVEDEA